MAKKDKDGRRLKGYYSFRKKYPSKRGSTYEIGESRKMKRKERTIKVLIAVLCVCLFSAVYIALSVCNILSRRPLPEIVEEEKEEFATVESVSKIKAVFVENKYIGNMADVDVILKNAKKSGFNAIMLDFKDRDGHLTYGSNLLKDVDMSKINPVTEQLLKKIKDEGFMVVARVFCFEDTIAPQRINAYVYADWTSGEIWLDGASINDGRVWLNPAYPSAQNYICKVLNEVSKLSVDCIYMQSVEFPQTVNGSVPVFTEDDTTLNRNMLLLDFIKNAVSSTGRVPVILGMDSDSIEGGNSEKYGGTLSDTSAVICSPFVDFTDDEDYVGKIVSKNQTLNNLVKDNFTTIKVIPTATVDKDDSDYFEKLKNSGLESYIIVP